MNAREILLELARIFGIKAERPFPLAQAIAERLQTAGKSPVHYQTLYLWLKGSKKPRISTLLQVMDEAVAVAVDSRERDRIEALRQRVRLRKLVAESDHVRRMRQIATALLLAGRSIHVSRTPDLQLFVESALPQPFPQMIPCVADAKTAVFEPIALAISDASALEVAASSHRAKVHTRSNEKWGLSLEKMAGLGDCIPWQGEGDRELVGQCHLGEHELGVLTIEDVSIGGAGMALDWAATNLIHQFVYAQGRWPFFLCGEKLSACKSADDLSSCFDRVWLNDDKLRVPTWSEVLALGAVNGCVAVISDMHKAISSTAFLRIISDCAEHQIPIVASCNFFHLALLNQRLSQAGLVNRIASVDRFRSPKPLRSLLELYDWRIGDADLREILGRNSFAAQTEGPNDPEPMRQIKIPAIALKIARNTSLRDSFNKAESPIPTSLLDDARNFAKDEEQRLGTVPN